MAVRGSECRVRRCSSDGRMARGYTPPISPPVLGWRACLGCAFQPPIFPMLRYQSEAAMPEPNRGWQVGGPERGSSASPRSDSGRVVTAWILGLGVRGYRECSLPRTMPRAALAGPERVRKLAATALETQPWGATCCIMTAKGYFGRAVQFGVGRSRGPGPQWRMLGSPSTPSRATAVTARV